MVFLGLVGEKQLLPMLKMTQSTYVEPMKPFLQTCFINEQQRQKHKGGDFTLQIVCDRCGKPSVLGLNTLDYSSFMSLLLTFVRLRKIAGILKNINDFTR